MHPILKFIYAFIALFAISFLFNAFTANSVDFLQWNAQAIFMSVLYSTVILLIYFIKLINDAEIKEHNYLDEEENY